MFSRRESTDKAMTIVEAERILDVVSTALQKPAVGGVRRRSELKGIDVVDIDTAVKLRVARLLLESLAMPNGKAGCVPIAVEIGLA